MSTIVDINGFLLHREIYFCDVFPRELQIHIEIEKDVINAAVIGEDARKNCVTETVAKKDDFSNQLKDQIRK